MQKTKLKKEHFLSLIIPFLLILFIMYTGCDLYTLNPSKGDSESNNNNSTTWTKLFGISGASTGANSITSDTNGNIYTTGWTDDNLDEDTLTGDLNLFVVKHNSSGIKQWIKFLSASGSGYGINVFSIASDTNGNIYTTGWTDGNIDEKTLTGDSDLFVVKYNTNGDKQWTRLLGVSGASTHAFSITSDSNGNIYTTGWTTGNLDGQTLIGDLDLFVVKYNTNGDKQWTRLLGASEANPRAYGITLDLNGNIYTTGLVYGDLDGQIKTGSIDLFIVKYNSSGMKQWTRLLGVSGSLTVSYSITSDTNGNIYTTGYTNGNLDEQTLTGEEDLFIVKYNTNGDKQWTKLLGSYKKKTRAKNITSDSNGNIYITGWTNGNLNGQTLTGEEDLFIVKYNTNGERQWIRLLGVSGAYTNGNGITSYTGGNIYAAGWTNGNLDGQTLTGVKDAFIVKYNSNGDKQ